MAPFLFIRGNMIKIKSFFSLIIAVIIIGTAGCLTDKGELVDEVPQEYCDTLQATYVSNTKILIDTYCATSSGCHGAQASNGDFTTFANLQASGALSESKIGLRVSSSDISFVMPPGNPLPDSIKQVFACWVSSDFPQQ